MDTLYLLLPLSVLVVLALIAVFAWALNAGQFDDLEREGWRVLEEDAAPVAPTPTDVPGVESSHNLDSSQATTNSPF